MAHWSPWTLAAILAAMLVGTLHAFMDLLLERNRAYRMFPKDWGRW